MSLDVTLTLDRPRRFRFGIFDLEKACEQLNATRGLKEEVDGIGKILQLLGRMNPPTWGIVLQLGLSHEDRTLKTAEAAKLLLNRYLEEGGSLEPISEGIIDAMHRSGLISKDLYDSVRTRRDGAGDRAPEGAPEDPPRGSGGSP